MATTDYAPQWFTTAVTKSNTTTTSQKSLYYLNRKACPMSDDSSRSHRRSSLCKVVTVPKKNKKNLKFNDGEGCCVVHQLDASDVAPEQLWFSKEEIQAIRKEGRDILAKVNDAGGDLDALEGDSIRGLEHGLSVRDLDSAILDDDALDRSERRKNIVSTILAQQQEQKDAGIDDPKGLQVTSKACTQWARDRALDTAEKDFADAVAVWREDAECNKLLPSILNKKSRRQSTRRSSVMSGSSDCALMSAAERKATLDTISKTVASALEELDDLDF